MANHPAAWSTIGYSGRPGRRRRGRCPNRMGKKWRCWPTLTSISRIFGCRNGSGARDQPATVNRHPALFHGLARATGNGRGICPADANTGPKRPRQCRQQFPGAPHSWSGPTCSRPTRSISAMSATRTAHCPAFTTAYYAYRWGDSGPHRRPVLPRPAAKTYRQWRSDLVPTTSWRVGCWPIRRPFPRWLRLRETSAPDA